MVLRTLTSISTPWRTASSDDNRMSVVRQTTAAFKPLPSRRAHTTTFVLKRWAVLVRISM